MDMLMMLVSLVKNVRFHPTKCCYFFTLTKIYIHTGCESGTIRLVNGAVPYEGRVEVCRDDAWGTVCDDFWSEEDARVACRWAGFSAISMFALLSFSSITM